MYQIESLRVLLTQAITPGTSDTSDIATPEAFDILRNKRRQFVISYIVANGGEVTIRELSEQLAVKEGSDRKNAHIALYQNHLPKLGKMGAVEYNDRTGSVSANRMTHLLKFVQTHAAWLLRE